MAARGSRCMHPGPVVGVTLSQQIFSGKQSVIFTRCLRRCTHGGKGRA